MAMTSPSALPKPPKLRSIMQALAALDAILSPEWEYRFYSFNAHWGEGEAMGSVRNGGGDDVFVLFTPDGCFVKGFAHEFENPSVSAEAFYEDVPAEFEDAAEEDAFSPDYVSYCTWWLNTSPGWTSSVDETTLERGAFFLLHGLDHDPEKYVEFAQDYYEVEIDLALVNAILNRHPITEATAKALNPDVDFAALKVDLKEIGFPVSD